MRCSACFSILLFFVVINPLAVMSDYRWHICNNHSTYADGSTYAANLNRLVSDLFTNTSVNSGFNTSSFGGTPNKVYGLLQCFGNLSADKCTECAQQANSSAMELCANDIGGLVLMDDCFLRYDNSNFISALDTDMYVYLWNPSDVSDNSADNFKAITSSLLYNLSNLAYNPANRRFALGSANYSPSETVYGLVQSWRYLPINDCRKCLVTARNFVEEYSSKHIGFRVLLGSCVVRFESNAFYGTREVPSPPTAAPSLAPTEIQTPTSAESPEKETPRAGENHAKEKHTKLPIVLGVEGGFILLLLICFIAVRKRVKFAIFGSPVTRERRGYSAYSEVLIHDRHFITSLDSLREATQNFHENNKLGEGGFGAVYKGTTRDGKQIAVKKLTARSAQGDDEFMNEVQLVANVQHRNLVKLLGCCAEEDERLLVYDYLPNRSLDTFLFHPEKHKLLDWERRYKIIFGIARGLLYLHEDSNMKIIHRDIKANNILLDDKLNPKIADFGLARLFPEEETQIQTRVAGTHGYMAPEYAMRGQLSVKADVYSFGVLLLEILSGRKNMDLSLSRERQSLLEWEWRLHREGDLISLVEATVRESCPQDQLVRHVNVALLCTQADATARPSMSSVILLISNISVTVPNPTKPPYLSGSDSSGDGLERLEKGTDTFTESQTSATTASSASGVPSVNETSITDMVPR